MAKVADVKRLLDEAEEFTNRAATISRIRDTSGSALDPYNVAARRGQEDWTWRTTITAKKPTMKRARASLWQVQKGWEEPVRKYGRNDRRRNRFSNGDLSGTARITNKLNSIIIKEVSQDAVFGRRSIIFGNERRK